MVRSNPWYKRYPGDFLNGIGGMGPGLIGCYAVVLDMIYDRGAEIPNDPHLIAGRLGCSTRLARSMIGQLLQRGKLIETVSGLTNMRAETEIQKSVFEGRKHAENGAKGGRTRAERAGQALYINELVQARLKHRARVQIPDSKITSSEYVAEAAKNGQAEKEKEAFVASPSLLATKLLNGNGGRR